MLAGYLMGKGARLQLTDREGDNALHWASFKGMYIISIDLLVSIVKVQYWSCWQNCFFAIYNNPNPLFFRRPAQCRLHQLAKFSASDLCSDGWSSECGFKSWLRLWCLCHCASHFTIIASLHPGVNGYLWGQNWLLCLISPMRWNGSNWAVYSPGSWDNFRNDLWARWAGVLMYEDMCAL